MHKLYCIFAMESIKKMGGNRGKLASMAGHAFLHSYWDAMGTSTPWSIRRSVHINKYDQAVKYQESGLAFKITLVVDTIPELITIQEKYKTICGTSLVTDAGRTVFGEPTVVRLGLGPIHESSIGDDLKALKVLI